MLNAEINVPRMCEVAFKYNFVVFVVDYRKAPETKTPGGMEDCRDVIRMVYKKVEEHGSLSEHS